MKKTRRAAAFLLAFLIFCGLFVSCGGEAGTFEARECLVWAVGARLPEPADFVASASEGFSFRFAETPDFTHLGDYTVSLIATDGKGNETAFSVPMTLTVDHVPPTLVGVHDFSVLLGEGVSYRSGVSVSDNCDGDLSFSVDTSAVFLNREGEYPVVYTATDAAGNVASVTVTVYVYRETVTLEDLNALIDPILSEIMPSKVSKTEQARAVYRYVYEHIDYTATSDKSDWVRAAYEGLRNGAGDCFTYFALSKAFFERLGIGNMDIQRTTGIVRERHYWNLVNVGSEQAPVWYHFDACHLVDMPESWGCLMTDAQIDAYSRGRTDADGVSGYFYAYDRSAYPATSQTVITKIN